MEISNIIPAGGRPQRIYCDKCDSHTELAYFDFDETVSGVSINIKGLPVLRCPKCEHQQLPDRSRVAIVRIYEQALKQSSAEVIVTRKKQTDRFDFTDVPFIYDPDDYFYLPGLYRSFDEGFLQPVFFKRQVLFKYNNTPGYSVKFASTTYGQIDTEGDYISFGINRHGNVVMWLGDIAKLPANEQHYLRSENIPSDHTLGSEFYDGQIEVKFTKQTKENELFRLRSEFLTICLTRFGMSLGHLDVEVLDLALAFNPPLIDTPKERRHVADTLNKVYIESFDNGALDKVVTNLGVKSPGSGSLKRLQTILQAVAPTNDIAALMSPLYALYDLRVAYSHLASESSSPQLVAVTTRLNLPPDASLGDIYANLLDGLIMTFAGMARLI
jgi:hypothetical protein